MKQQPIIVSFDGAGLEVPNGTQGAWAVDVKKNLTPEEFKRWLQICDTPSEEREKLAETFFFNADQGECRAASRERRAEERAQELADMEEEGVDPDDYDAVKEWRKERREQY